MLIVAFFSRCKFALGRNLMFQHDYEAAQGLFMEANEFWLKGDQSRASDFYGGVIYRIGCCALLQGDVDSALYVGLPLTPTTYSNTDTFCLPRKHIEDAMTVTSVRQEIMVGEHARCLYKMSEILYQIPGRELEADQCLRHAEELYRKRVGQPELSTEADQADQTALKEGRKEADYDALVFVHWR